MTPPPIALGLSLCNLVIIDQDTRNPSLVGLFTGLEVERFPSDPQRFSVFAALSNGRGKGKIELVSTRLDTDEAIYSKTGEVSFPDPLKVVNVRFRIRNIVFPDRGNYEFVLLVDGDMIARCRLRVYKPE